MQKPASKKVSANSARDREGCLLFSSGSERGQGECAEFCCFVTEPKPYMDMDMDCIPALALQFSDRPMAWTRIGSTG